MARLVSAIIKDYLNPGDREAQMIAFGELEDYLGRIASLSNTTVMATDVTITTQDVEVILFNLTVLGDDMFDSTDDIRATRVLLKKMRAYLNLIYVVCGLNREQVLCAYRHKPACKLVSQ